MAQIRGNTQIIAGTILNAQIATGAGITNDKFAAFTQTQSAGGFKITNLLDPTNPQDAATKNYADSLASGLSWKEAVKVVATTNQALTGVGQVIDGYTLVAGDRVLLTAQTTASQNNVYLAAAGAWSIAPDCTNGPGLQSATVTVENGTASQFKTYTQTVETAIVVGTTSLTWVLGPSIQPISFLAGLAQTGNTVNVVPDASLLATTGLLKVNVDNTTLATGTTLGVKAAGITATQLATSVAGGGLTGGAGTALTVRKKVDTSASGITGLVNGANTAFTLSATPSPAAIEDIYVNGLIQQPTVDYSITGTAVTMVVAPQTGDLMLAKYPY